MGSACCSYQDVELAKSESQDAIGIRSQNPNIEKFFSEPNPAEITTKSSLKNINLSIDIPVAWEYEPVLIKTLYSDDKIDLRAHIENNMVDHGLDYNDKLSAEFVNEVLDDEFFGQITRSMLLKKVFY